MQVMYLISEAAKEVGLSRTALLYYEKLNIIKSKRSTNGYRQYSERDLQRIKLLQLLMAGGLTLNECKSCLEAQIDHEVLKSRLKNLELEIREKQKSKELLGAMLGIGDTESWHQEANKLAPDVHLEWLIKQGFNEKEALRLKWLSRNMTEHEQYMTDFMKVFDSVERWGPSSEKDTLKALSLVPHEPKNILDIGCGKGMSTLLLAKNSSAKITALDNEQSALDYLVSNIKRECLSSRAKTICASMTDLPFDKSSFDLIWAEGSAYVMGVQNAVKTWNPVLKDNGILMLSDLVWLTDNPSNEPEVFWENEYPDMQTVISRNKLFKNSGYELVTNFPMSSLAWENYYKPLKKKVNKLKIEMPDSAALEDLSREIEIYTNYHKEFGYQMFILKKI